MVYPVKERKARKKLDRQCAGTKPAPDRRQRHKDTAGSDQANILKKL